ncbi:calmodulin-binding receptor-like cytoplasmic kinase 2 isoform X1 [Amaranthus tricolor]|uniref:calmodulin-binding receptor-like cytoplasmic kinase 2 isoform X1 n=1 Tax=Amaranthus tricolor TaxID=29722 RepID=UPI00258A1E57|nr:calmodulin-binding receptor-like cytoplasmic kinase 2 isoform X1 [Amaranthus tricolor]
MKNSPVSSSNRSYLFDSSSSKSQHNQCGALSMMQIQKNSSLFYQFFKKFTIIFSAVGYNSKSDAPEVDQGYGIRNSNKIHSNSSGFSSKSQKEGSSTRQPDSFNPSESSSGEVFGSLNFTLQDINQATKNFSQNNVIGDGGFGTVYKGQLKDGNLVAIKRAKKELYDKRTAQEFKSEVLAYSKIEHLNLVKFYGYLEHLDEKIIVVEYVGNGTLFDHLHGNQGRVLELAERLDISVDVAHAITYLHTYNDPPIIHRDIKASNILITEKLRAKVADFGLARFVPEVPDVTHISTQIKGTAGYLDPEYMKSYQLTEKSDVYSFGILLVELMTGRHPIEPCKGVKERVTIRWAMNKLREGMPVLAMDPRLNRSPSSIKVVKNILELAQKCTGPVRQSRPSMKDSVEVLWAIRKELKEGNQLNYCASHRSVDLLEKEARKVRQESLGIEGETYSLMSA